MMAEQAGALVIPVWNKSNREHGIVGSEPSAVREAADAAARQMGWTHAYHVDADHIDLATVDRFIDASDFYTLDVAKAIGKPAAAADVEGFLRRHSDLAGRLTIDGIQGHLETTRESLKAIAEKYLVAAQEAGRTYRRIAEQRGEETFIAEISLDETEAPQTAAELLVILAAMADERIPVQTVAPKFVGRFNKGVDYAGDVAQFEECFRSALAVTAYAVRHYALPENLKLSVHSGSDKFSIYGRIRRALRDFDAGIHLKTAGTSWLEELIGLAEAGGAGLEIAKEIYAEAHAHREEWCAPYAAVIGIDPGRLPAPDEVRRWTAEQYMSALRHDRSNPAFNPDLRQLPHVGYKAAAKMGRRYLDALERYEETIARNVTTNLFERHIEPLFLER